MAIEELIWALKAHIHFESVDLKNMGHSRYYADVKEAIGLPSTLNLVADEIYKILNPETTCVVGNGYGGSFVPVLASRHNLRFSMVRDKPKGHGRTKGHIEHYIPIDKDKVAILDDVLSTGRSQQKTGAVITSETNAKIIGYYVVYKRGELKVKLNAPLKFLLCEKDLL